MNTQIVETTVKVDICWTAANKRPFYVVMIDGLEGMWCKARFWYATVDDFGNLVPVEEI